MSHLYVNVFIMKVFSESFPLLHIVEYLYYTFSGVYKIKKTTRGTIYISALGSTYTLELNG